MQAETVSPLLDARNHRYCRDGAILVLKLLLPSKVPCPIMTAMRFLSIILVIVSAGFAGCASSGSSVDNASWRDKYQPASNVTGLMPYGGKTVCAQFYDRNFERDARTNISMAMNRSA
jgi:hypothetical protein